MCRRCGAFLLAELTALLDKSGIWTQEAQTGTQEAQERRWDGPGLEASTRNGLLTLTIPDGYGSGTGIQTSDRSPVNGKAPVCAGATRSPGIIRIGNGDPIERLSTVNVPL